ncbi:MAG: aldo/keto reductase, partial [Dehalococcoidia bacterium]
LKRAIEHEVVPACNKFGLGMLPYFPLASGFLTGKYRRGEALPEGSRLAAWGPRAAGIANEANFDVLEGLERFAQERGHSMLELAFSWLASQPVTSSVIAGATSPDQVKQNARAADWVLNEEEMKEVDGVLKGS